MKQDEFSKIKIYGELSFDQLLKEIHTNAKDTHDEIKNLINQLSSYINSPSSAQMIVPLIAEYLNINVRNQSQLLKMADVIQKHIKSASKTKDDTGKLGFSDQDMKALLDSVKDIDDVEDIDYSEINEEE